MPPLQAADVLACEAYRRLAKELGAPAKGDYYLFDLVEVDNEKDRLLLFNQDRLLQFFYEHMELWFPGAEGPDGGTLEP
jgi:hypothetical protein